MYPKQKKWLAALAAATVALGVITGCGGGDDNAAPNPSVNITRSTEATFSESARILAARVAAAEGATWLNADVARRFDADLAAVRQSFPDVRDISAFPEYDLRTVLVAVRAGTPWEANWRRGDAATGEAALDELLREFAPEEITAAGVPAGTTPAYFALRFGQSLNMVKLAERLSGASANIIAADPNRIVGDGNTIVFLANGSGGARGYVFSRGSGDCPAGCINRRNFEFAVSPDGTSATLVREYDGRIP